MKHRSLSQAAAYDVARREFYKHRHLEDIRRRVAKEEALHVGAYFGKGPLEVGMELEDRVWGSWKDWASKQIEEEDASRAQMFSGPQAEDEGTDEAGYGTAIDELQASMAPKKEGTRPGGAVPNT